MTISRRNFLTSTSAAAFAAAIQAAASAAADPQRPRIVLRSSWQTVNIGDIAHTPGVLALLEKHLPLAEVRLWPSKVDNGVEQLLKRRFPRLAIAQTPEEIARALAECDFLLHGSGPSLVATKDVARWQKETGKPYGIYGITFSSTDPAVLDLVSGAKFAFFRDTVSLQFAKDQGVKCPIMEFGPDGAFAVDLRADDRAEAFLREHKLEPGRFMCCIGRLRNTPYWKIHGREMTAEDHRKHGENEAHKEADHASLRQAIEAVVGLGMKVLVCPEDQSQMAVGKELLVDPLPAKVRDRVVWRENYWLTDEALSTYRLSAGLFGNEMHSPIMCIGNGIPAVVCRWKQQTSKGFMWRDIGLGEWLFDLDDPKLDRGRIVAAVKSIAADQNAAREKVGAAREVVLERQRKTMEVVGKGVGLIN
ncbi:MAG: polysaccharide pyruvyl transferase family protein [Pirellulaceae bacterium]|nr:polysaccharide pyruvyl transferase family protein [Pirellulaceae bacterium]